MLHGRKLSLKTRRIYRSGVRTAKRNGSETCCLRENGIAVLRTEKVIRVKNGVQSIKIRSSYEHMDLQCLEKAQDRLARACRVRWYGYVLRRDGYGV